MRLWATLFVFIVLGSSRLPGAASTAEGMHGAVATDQTLASRVGLRVLQTGGSAVDAAVAIGYALAVTLPSAGNIGGGGFMLLHLRDGSSHFIDFRETAPGAATENMYRDAAGTVVPERSTVGALSIAVPGTVAGLELARTRYGTRSLHDSLAPAIALAEQGFVLGEGDARAIAASAALLGRFSRSAAIFLPGGRAPRAGDVFAQPALAATLREIDRGGADAFYRGALARRIVAGIRAAGGIVTADDFARFRALERLPLACGHRSARIVTAPPPSSGGVVICETLGILGEAASPPSRSVADAHAEIEAERRAFADRSSALGDPDFVRPRVAQLLDPAHLARERASIAPERATPSSALRGLLSSEGTNTTNYSVIDRDGNAVDVTYTLNSSFGSGLVAGDTGVLLNDEMDDFASAPGVPNQFGLVQGAFNAIAPYKRPLSSMSPTIVLDEGGHVVLIAGAAGGPRIITATLDIVRAAIDFGEDVGAAVDAPRLHEQWLPDVVYAEPGTFDPAAAAALRRAGYAIDVGPAGSAANAIAVRADGTRVAAHDERRGTGAALAY